MRLAHGITLALLALAGVSIASTLPSCGGSSSSSNSSAAQGSDVIVIGVSDTLTGGLKGIGVPLQNSIRLAEQYINSLGGILGKRVKYVVEDDQSDEGDIVRATVQKLLGGGAVAIIGPNGSGQVAAVQDFLNQQQVLEISATATSTALSKPGSYFFRTVPPDNYQGAAVVTVATRGPLGLANPDAGAGTACKKMALFYYTNTYGTAMAGVIKTGFASQGTIATDIQVDTAVKADYKAEVAQIVAAKPDCLAMIVYDDVGDVFMRDLMAATTPPPAGWNPSFFVIGTDGVYTEDFIVNGRANKANPTSPTVVEGVYGTNPNTNPANRPEYNEFKNLYLSQFSLPSGQTELDAYTANEFDAAILIALAIEKAGGTDDKQKLRDSLIAISTTGKAFTPGTLLDGIRNIREGVPAKYSGASGDLVFSADGNVVAGYIVWHVKNGAFETIAELPPVAPQ
jgi:branched-chain amino acid transport system substrate-binding protein